MVETDDGNLMVQDEGIKKCFYNLCAEEDVIYAKSMLVPEPIAPLATPMQTTKEYFGRVPRVYIESLRDNAILSSEQK